MLEESKMQGDVLFVCTQPVVALHESFVQAFPSSQFKSGPPMQASPWHLSSVVHAFPSSQGAPAGHGSVHIFVARFEVCVTPIEVVYCASMKSVPAAAPT